MSTDQLPPFLTRPSDKWMNVVAGVVLLVAGVGLVGVDLFFLAKALSPRRSLGFGAWVLLAVPTFLGTFCLFAGYRLVGQRPNRYGAVLSPWTCYGLALASVTLAGSGAVTMVSHNSYRDVDGVLAALLFSWFCFGAGRHIHVRKRRARAP